MWAACGLTFNIIRGGVIVELRENEWFPANEKNRKTAEHIASIDSYAGL